LLECENLLKHAFVYFGLRAETGFSQLNLLL